MSAKPFVPVPAFRRIPAAMRILALLALSLLLHMLAIDWAGFGFGIGRPQQPQPELPAVTIALHPPAPAEPLRAEPAPSAPAPRAAMPKPKLKPRAPRPRSVPPPAPVEDAAPAVAAAAEAIAAAEPAPEPASTDAETAQKPQEIAPAPPAAEAAPPAPEAPRHVFRMPPSAELKYDVQALREGQKVYGSGKIAWRTDGKGYRIDGQAGVMFFTVLEFQSSGALDDDGVAPMLYAEKRFRKPQTHTHFRRDAGLISFSASTASYPRRGGEQDRASIVWQLAALGLGDPGVFQPEAKLEIFVAGVRDAETWSLRVLGREQVASGAGTVDAWHVVRIPRPGSYEQQLDIWLAADRDWYPVRLRYTETSGDYLDLLASSITPLGAAPPL